MTFGDWLRLHRKRKYLTIEDLAKKVGRSKQYISVLEREEPHALTGKPVKPSEDVVEALAAALGTDLDEARLAAGYAPLKEVPAIFHEFEDLSEADQLLVKQMITSLAGKENRHFDMAYIDDDDDEE